MIPTEPGYYLVGDGGGKGYITRAGVAYLIKGAVNHHRLTSWERVEQFPGGAVRLEDPAWYAHLERSRVAHGIDP